MSQPYPNSLGYRLLKGLRNRLVTQLNSSRRKLGISIWRKKIIKHLPPGRIYQQQFWGNQLYFKAPQEFLHGIEEIFIQEVYKQQLPPNAKIIDCGANIGLSLIYLKTICPQANITAFEPDTDNFELLRKNIHSFELTTISPIQAAVWNRNGLVPFISSHGMASRLAKSTLESKEMIRSVRLRDYINEPIDFLKLDVEGAEYDIVTDIEDRLFFVKSMFIEYHGFFKKQNELTELLALLTRANFTYYLKEAAVNYKTPLCRKEGTPHRFEIQLNIFCFRDN